MKTWQKVILWIAIVIVVLICGVVAVYKFYIEPTYVDKLVQKAEAVLKDETIRTQVDNFVEELRTEGLLEDEQIQGYLKFAEAQKAKAQQGTEEPQNPEDQPPEQGGAQIPSTEDPNSVKPHVDNKFESETEQEPSGSDPTQTKKPQNNKKPNNKEEKPKSSTEKVMEAMTTEELSFAYSLYDKVDVGYVSGLMNSDPAAAKEYIKNHLSSGEISRAVDIYAKYSHLLNQ